MKFTRNLKIFTIISLVLNISFVLCLKFDWLVEVTKESNGSKTYSTFLPFYYTIILIVSYFVLIKTDKVRERRYDLELMYSVVFYASLIISVFVAMIFIPEFRTVTFLVLPLAFAGIALFLQWITTRKRTKGLKSKSVFK